jgi:predicted GNAT family acetyltransferase
MTQDGETNTPRDEIAVRNNEAAHRYEVQVDSRLALISYERHGDRIIFIHTLVPPAMEGHGLAAKMARFALEDARAQHLVVIPRCPYVASYIQRHPEYVDLVPPEERTRVLPSSADQNT